MTIRILLVDDRYLIQEGVKAILRNETKIKIVGTAKNGIEAIALTEELQPDIVLLDIEMPKMNGIAATKHIREIAPATKVIVLSSHENPKYITLALKAGASGYLLKDSFVEDLKQAIYSLSRGYSYIEAKLLADVVSQNKANNIVKSAKTKVYVHKYGKNIYTPKTTAPQEEFSTSSPSKNKAKSGINRASLAPIFELSEFQEFPVVSKNQKSRPKTHNKKLFLLIIAIASLILSLIIF